LRNMDQEKKYYSINEVSKILSVSMGTVYNYIGEGYLKAIKLGKKTIRISKKNLDQFTKDK